MPESRAVHLIDDDAGVRDSTAFLLASAGVAVVTHESAHSFLQALPRSAVSCVITDIRMPDMTGIELLQKLATTRPDLPVIIITGHADVPLAVVAMKLGAADFIEKPFDDTTLIGSVGRALDRQTKNEHIRAERASVLERLHAISGRERQVLDGLIAGKANKMIAFDLDISPRTVEVYRANLMTKMQAASLSDLVRMALLAGDDVMGSVASSD